MSNDRKLIARLRRGNKEALAEVYREHKDRLVTLGSCLLGDRAAAEDCLHDVFLKFVSDAVALRIRGNLKGYFSSCILNRARDQLRKDTKWDRKVDGTAMMAGPKSDPIVQLESLEESRRVQRAFAVLPLEQREAVALHLQDGLTFRKIAVLQSVSINTVQSRYRYGIRKLRELLTEKEER